MKHTAGALLLVLLAYLGMLPLWQKGEYFPLAFSRARVEEVTRHRLKLTPAGR